MATTKQIQTLTTRVIFDNAFRARFLESPKKAAAELEIKLTRQELAYLKTLSPEEINQIARQVQQLTHMESGLTHWA